jgi:hypothetical protein
MEEGGKYMGGINIIERSKRKGMICKKQMDKGVNIETILFYPPSEVKTCLLCFDV